AQANGDIDGIAVGADAVDDFAEETGAILKRPAVPARPFVSAEELVEEVAMAMLDVHEVGPGIPCDARRPHVLADQIVEFSVAEDLVIACHSEALVEQWMSKRHPRFGSFLVSRPTEAS